MQIREIMSRDVEVISPDTPVVEAARMMRDIDSGFLPVGENDRLVGTLTDRDIVLRSTAEGQDPSRARVREVMSRQLYYCFEDDEHEDAAALMGEKQIRRLPILNRDKRLVGVVSLGDIATRTGDDAVTGQTVEDVSKPAG